MNKYILVKYPESQKLVEHSRFNECLLVQDTDENIAYLCPEDLYEKIFNTDNIESKRIGNFIFRKANYLDEEPEFPLYYIDYLYPNFYYGKESEFIKEGEYYIDERNSNIKLHKSCFEPKENYITLAFFKRNKDGLYKPNLIEDRYFYINEVKSFFDLIKYGYKELNKLNKND